MGKFSNQVVFITGGSSGIGAETSRHFIDEGAQVFVADIEERDIVQSLGSKNAHFMRCDVSNSTSCEEAIAACIQQYGRLDILFANAGMLQPSKSVVEQSIEVFHRVMETNLYSLFYLARSAIPQMQKQGKGVILATASTSGLGGDWGNAPYCASKAAVINLCRVLAIDHADEGIRVNALCPGFIFTPMAPTDLAVLAMAKETIPLGRGGDVKEIAKTALFLASDDASYITGQAIIVDGGLRARNGFPKFAKTNQ